MGILIGTRPVKIGRQRRSFTFLYISEKRLKHRSPIFFVSPGQINARRLTKGQDFLKRSKICRMYQKTPKQAGIDKATA